MLPHKSRYLVLIGALLLTFGALFFRMYTMQVVDVESYVESARQNTQKTLKLYGMRGTIYDSDMIPIAYSRRSFDVQFYRDPSRATAADRAAYTESIIKIIDLIESKGKQTISEFWLERGEDGQWRFNTGTANPVSDAKRQSQWRGNFAVTNVEVQELFARLCENYAIPEEMPEEKKLKVLAIWQESRMNAFQPRPVTIAVDVNFETGAQIEARSMELLGVSVAESSTRVYPKKSVGAHTIGYISKISGDEIMKEYSDRGYPNDALVGMTGIEYELESELTPFIKSRQGERTVELSNRGKIIREIDQQTPVNGNDVVLTIDMQLMSQGAKSLEKVVDGIRKAQMGEMRKSSWKEKNRTELRRYASLDQPVKTAQTGAFVAINPHTGEVLAIDSYPSYDLSMFGSGIVDPDKWNEVVKDERNPMYNRAVSTRDTPGSIFKMVTALGALQEGVLTLDRRITDRGEYRGTGDTSHRPKCWISSETRYKHADLDVVGGISNSCNYFFYTVGQELGSENLTKWGAMLGLTSKTRIELPNESTSFIGNQMMLYDSERPVANQYTSKPVFAASMIKRKFRQIGADRGITYDEELLDTATKMLLDIVTESGPKSDWNLKIRNILLEKMNIPLAYIQRHLLGNTFFYYLNDLRWTDNETIMASIGQSITQVTPVAVARYVAAIVNSGTVYDLQLVDKLVSPTGQVVLDKHPTVINKIDADTYFAKIREGMENVTSVENEGTAANAFKTAKNRGIKVAAKTGTAQRSKVDIENNSWLVCYAPAEDPQIVVVVYVQNGYAGLRSANCAEDIILAYLTSKKLKDPNTIPAVARLTD